MIIDKYEILKRLVTGERIAGTGDQRLAMAKRIMSEQIQRPVSEMMAMYTPNDDVAVRAKRKEIVR